MRVGAVFIMHVRQLQVRAATPIPFVALRSAAPSARVSESGNCWGVGAGGRGGGADGQSLRRQTPSPCYLDRVALHYGGVNPCL